MHFDLKRHLKLPLNLPIRQTRFWIALSLLAASLLPAAAAGAPLLRCKVEQAGSTHLLEFAAQSDPYTAKIVTISKSFRFKAVVVGDQKKIDYIKIYTYYQTGRQPVLMHEAKYLNPVAQASGAPFDALTGQHYLYAPWLNRELQYGCALVEEAA